MLSGLWKKLQLKTTSLIVINSPSSFESSLNELSGSYGVFKSFDKKSYASSFALCFVTSKAQVDEIVAHLAKLEGDPLVWFAYLKGTSKLRAKNSDISRDKGFESLAKVDFEPVSAVAIDNDWTALRFRRVSHIKEMMRQFAKTEEGKEKVAKARAEGKSCVKPVAVKKESKPKSADTTELSTAETKKRKRN